MDDKHVQVCNCIEAAREELREIPVLCSDPYRIEHLGYELDMVDAIMGAYQNLSPESFKRYLHTEVSTVVTLVTQLQTLLG